MCVSEGYSVFECVLRLKILPRDLHCYLMVYRLKTDIFGKGMLSSTLMDLMVLKSPLHSGGRYITKTSCF